MRILRGRTRRVGIGAETEADRIAADWLAHLDRHGGDESDHPELVRWLDADVRNRGAFVRAQALWLMLDSGRVLSTGDAADDNAKRPLLTRRAAFTGVAASLVAASTGVLLVGLPSEAKAFSTDVGEIKRFRLDDGSTMVLDTDSKVEALIDEKRREIRLVAGGVWFDVAANPVVPFVALTDRLRVRGQAASFEFRVSPRPEILVARGELSLKRRSAIDADEYRLKSGTKATFEADGIVQIENVSATSISRLLEWREGGLTLDGETVGYAVEVFNRYNHRKLIVTDPELVAQPLVGQFEVNRPQDFAEAVALSFDAEVRGAGSAIRIEPRKKL